MTSQNFAPTRDPQNVTSNGDVRPRQLVHRGTIQARALWFAFELMGEENARHRVLESWRSGSVVHRFADGFLLIWPDSQRVVCEASPALPLTENDGVLSSCPLSRDEWRQLLGNEKRATPLVIFVRESRAQLVSLGVATTENVASWLDVSNFALQSAQSLGEAPRAPLLLAEPIDFVARRALIGQEADAQLQRVLDSLRGEKTAAKTNGFGASLQALGARFLAAIDGVRWWQKTRVGTRKPLSLLTLCLLAALALALLRSHFWTVLAAIFLLWLLREILPAVEVPQGANPVSAGSGSASRNPARASAFADLVARFVARFAARFSFAHRAKTAQKQLGFQPKTRDNLNDAMRRALAKALALSQLSGLVGRHQARYVARMMEMFERGDWDSALRHAIPMGALSGAGNNWKAPPFLGRLFARSDLKINANWQSVGSTIGLSEEWSVRMRALYRRAFESLSERGRWEEAAFVLAELLGDNEEAVAFLELHDRKTLAAEMAEARDLPAGLVVRQWFVAGDETRAIAVARRTDSFADAVFRLEQKHDERAQWLRVLWARSLGQSGQYAAAVEALWPIESLRESTRAYREMALESGGQSAARVLARWLQLDPDALDDETLRYRVLDLLNDESRENARAFGVCAGFARPKRRTFAQPRDAKRGALDGSRSAARLRQRFFDR